MFNSHLFNVRTFNGSFVNNTVYSTDHLAFENFSLSDGSVMLMSELRDSGPPRELLGGRIPRGNGDYVIGDRFGERIIEASGVIYKSSASELSAFIKTIQRNLLRREGNLDVTDDDGTVRRYVATMMSFDELTADRRGYHITFCPWKAKFVCKTPFGKSRVYSSYSLSASTTVTHSMVNEGTAEADPVITLNFDAASSVTAVTVTNNTTGESITYTGAIAAGDILVFNSERLEVTLNGTEVDFAGAFIPLNVGANLIEAEVTGTSFIAYDTFSHRDSYL